MMGINSIRALSRIIGLQIMLLPFLPPTSGSLTPNMITLNVCGFNYFQASSVVYRTCSNFNFVK